MSTSTWLVPLFCVQQATTKRHEAGLEKCERANNGAEKTESRGAKSLPQVLVLMQHRGQFFTRKAHNAAHHKQQLCGCVLGQTSGCSWIHVQ